MALRTLSQYRLNTQCVIAVLAVMLGLGACVTLPAERFDRIATRYGFRREIIAGAPFHHVAYRNDINPPATVVHVYLDGDGTPWIRARWIAQDPTPRNALVLKLMALDPSSSIYLGRPCYHGLAAQCTPWLWTYGRYSERVVDSLAEALRGLMRMQAAAEVVLIGYSGGGVLAMLLAERVKAVRTVVTIAGNLDIEAWTAHHGYLPLVGSLNPLREGHLDHSVRQIHLVGGEDRIVPQALSRAIVQRYPQAEVRVINAFDHACCWASLWLKVLAELHYGANRTATADTDSDYFTASLGAGYDLGIENLSYGVYTRATYLDLTVDGYQEKGAGGLDLAVEDQDITSLTSALGVRVGYTLSPPFGVLAPQARAEWLHEFKDDSRTIVARYINDPRNNQLRAITDAPDENYFAVALGISSVFEGGLQAFLEYETLLGLQDIEEHLFTGGVRLEF